MAAFGGGFAYPLSCRTNLHDLVGDTECAGAYAGGDWSASGGDGAGWARAAESKRALIKIDLASIVSTIVPLC